MLLMVDTRNASTCLRTSGLAKASSSVRESCFLHISPPHTMATILRQGARPLLLQQTFRHATRSMSSQFGFGSPLAPERQRPQETQAFSPIPYVTESVVCPHRIAQPFLMLTL